MNYGYKMKYDQSIKVIRERFSHKDFSQRENFHRSSNFRSKVKTDQEKRQVDGRI